MEGHSLKEAVVVMQRPYLLVVLISFFSLNSCSTHEKIALDEIQSRAADAPYAVPAGIEVLTEAEIREKIIGNTLVGQSSSYAPEMVEYFHQDGSITARWRGDYSEGFWTISRSLLCIYYPDRSVQTPRDRSMFHCYTLFLDVDKLTLYDQAGREEQEQFMLLPGNERSLDLDIDIKDPEAEVWRSLVLFYLLGIVMLTASTP